MPGPRVNGVEARELYDNETSVVHRSFAWVMSYSDGRPMRAWDTELACGLRDGSRFDVIEIEQHAKVTCLNCLANEETARAKSRP